MTVRKPLNVLFLCTHNSARSIIAEAVLNRLGDGKLNGFSAGSMPSGKVHPHALDLLHSLKYDTRTLRSKPWDEFAVPGAPPLDFVFTVCDNAAGETCPVWPGQPITAHWGLPDPSAVHGTDVQRKLAFTDTHRMLYQRINAFVNLPFETLSRMTLKHRLEEIGRGHVASSVEGV